MVEGIERERRWMMSFDSRQWNSDGQPSSEQSSRNTSSSLVKEKFYFCFTSVIFFFWKVHCLLLLSVSLLLFKELFPF